MTLRELEILADLYFECKLSEEEEKDLARVVAVSPLRSEKLDELRFLLGLETGGRKSLTGAKAGRSKIFKRLIFWSSAAAVLLAGGIALSLISGSGSYDGADDSVYIVYQHGKKVEDPVKARELALAEMEECLRMQKELSDYADECIEVSKQNINKNL